MMPNAKNPYLATAAVLALGWSMLGPMPIAAQPEGAESVETASKKPADRPTSPPTNLRKVGDHWTPYNPPDPESFPPDAVLHIIVPGEHLWGLADLTYNNPYLWPQLWDANRYITDSHWIYPGDPLLLPPRPVVVTQAGPDARPGVPGEIVPQGQDGAPATNLEPMPIPEPVQAPLTAESDASSGQAGGSAGSSDGTGGDREAPLVDETDIRCSGYITESGKRGDLFIAANDEPGYHNVITGSIVYLNVGQDDERMKPGAMFNIVQREGKVLHPMSDKAQGYFIKRLGEIRVLKVLPDTAVASVTFACDEVRVGHELVAIEYQAVPTRVPPAFDRLRLERNGKATGYVIRLRDSAVRVATGDLVQIDLGSEDGINPGDFLTAFNSVHQGYRHHQPDYHFKYGSEIYSGADLHYDNTREEYPARPVGQLVVVSTAVHTSTVKIIHSVAEVQLGTMVEVD